jgi:hypothetical protein
LSIFITKKGVRAQKMQKTVKETVIKTTTHVVGEVTSREAAKQHLEAYLRGKGLDDNVIKTIVETNKIDTAQLFLDLTDGDLMEMGIQKFVARSLLNGLKNTSAQGTNVTGMHVSGGSVTIGAGGCAGVNYGEIKNTTTTTKTKKQTKY